MRRLCAVLLAALVAVGVTAGPALSHHYDDDHHYDRHGYYDDCYYDSDCDGYYYDGGHHHGHGYYDGPRCVFRQQVGAISVDFLCHY